MHRRFDDVEPAHFKTFRWIFEDSSLSSDDEAGNHQFHDWYSGSDDDFISSSEIAESNIGSESEAEEEEDEFREDSDKEFDKFGDGSENETYDFSEPSGNGGGGAKFSRRDNGHDTTLSQSFIHWLSLGDGIFHITGKLGSGKSTLMKFLCEHECTRRELNKWAGDRKLVFASHFFWKPGTPLQKSLTGLLRSLLHETLKVCPDLVPSVLPDQWQKLRSTSWQVPIELQFDKSDIKQAFARLMKQKYLYSNQCFCFFIDGLDEYEDSHQNDYKYVAELLRDWVSAGPQSIKMCVSSREYNVFLNAFSSERRLRLQDLTENDILRYVRDKIDVNEQEDLDKFVKEIINKGNGIFLWIVLVVKTLRQKLDDGYELLQLAGELDSLPEELEGLFKHLLQSQDRASRKKAYQMFEMMANVKDPRYGLLQDDIYYLTLSTYSFLEKFEADPAFAVHETFPFLALDAERKKTMIARARKHVNGICKGLVETSANVTYMGQKESIVIFTHRSIPEFLDTEEIQDERKMYLKDFHGKDPLSHLILADLRSGSGIEPSSASRAAAMLICKLATESRRNNTPFPVVEALNYFIAQNPALMAVPKLGNELCVGFFLIEYSWVEERRFENSGIGGDTVMEADPDEWFYIVSPLCLSALLGNAPYCIWKIRNDETILQNHEELSVLLRCLCCTLFFPLKGINTKPGATFDIFKVLLEQGLQPQMVAHTFGAPKHPECGERVELEGLTVWEHFMICAVAFKDGEASKDKKIVLSKTFLLFLHHGADPHVYISSFKHEGDDYIGIESHKTKVGMRVYEMELLTYASFADNAGKLSLRGLVKSWAFDNEATILELMEKDSRVQEQENETSILQALSDQSRVPLIEDGAVAEITPSEEVGAGVLIERCKDRETRHELYTRVQGWVRSLDMGYLVTFLVGIFLAAVILRMLGF